MSQRAARRLGRSGWSPTGSKGSSSERLPERALGGPEDSLGQQDCRGSAILGFTGEGDWELEFLLLVGAIALLFLGARQFALDRLLFGI